MAVFSVVIFHAFPAALRGGFIGVDVFFVISGFLISTILFQSFERGTFSFTEFYARRVLRIFPALSLMLFAVLVAGWFLAMPDEYKQLGKHVAAGVAFVSNLTLWKEAGYFDTSADYKPLLHLWSLGIEEQYYIVWPLVLWVAWRRRVGLLSMTIAIGAASFALNILGVGRDEVGTFYSPLSRFWEIASGALLAWVCLYRKDLRARLNAELAASAGLVLLLGGFFFIHREIGFPGVWAMIPVGGAVLIIAAGPDAWVNRWILSSRVAVWFGLISFPLYLWHWPLLSFLRMTSGEFTTRGSRIAAVSAAVGLAWATFAVVEKRVRFGGNRRAKVSGLVTAMVFAAALGVFTYAKRGFGFRFPPLIQQISDFKFDHEREYREGTCFLKEKQDFRTFAQCADGGNPDGKSLLLWGDSHAAHLYPGFREAFGESYRVVQRTASACPPIPNVDVKDRPHCRGINDAVLALVRELRPDRVVLAADWLNVDPIIEPTVAKLRELGVANIDLIGPVPEWIISLPKQLYLSFKRNPRSPLPYRMSFGLNPKVATVDDGLREKARALNIRYVSPKEILCDADGCITRLGEKGETIVAWDHGHLTSQGSRYLVSKFPK